MTATQLFDEFIDTSAAPGRVRESERLFTIATLGPTGTSSEVAAAYAGELVTAAWARPARIQLHESFEQSADAVRHGEADAVVVANAYASINEFYMDPELELVAAFIRSTPDYGLAALPSCPLPVAPRITTHPAPVRLISELLPMAFLVGETLVVSSTSVAARMVAEGLADIALTNETSCREYGLRFISNTRPIRMLWSVFTRSGRYGEGADDGDSCSSIGRHDARTWTSR